MGRSLAAYWAGPPGWRPLASWLRRLPLVHLELEVSQQKGDSESERINYPDEEPENNSMMYKQEGDFVRDLDKLWLHVNPSG